MSKLCSVCGTENRDEAQFCRACGTAFTAPSSTPAVAADGSSANACAECGFQNKPGIRYCANCGMSLVGQSGAANGGAEPRDGDEPYARSGPPPLSYESFATVAPYPAQPRDTDHSALFDRQTTPDIPDPDAAIALRQQEGLASHGDTAAPFQVAAAPNRTPLILGIVVAALAAAGIAGWLFMGSTNSAPAQPGATPAPVATPPIAATPAPAPAPAPIIIEEASPAATATDAASPNAMPPPQAAPAVPLGPPPTAAPALGAPPTAAQPLGASPTAATPLPQGADPGADAQAKRLAAEKRRDKAARDKAERDAKAKSVQDQRDQSAATQRSEQEAQARRRAEEAQRARPSAAVPPSPPPVAQARGVREICAGRGTIAEAVCQSRQCGQGEHANEAICRQLRDADERRRNMQN